jgi:hypothetical protein
LLHRKKASHQKYKLAVIAVCAKGFRVGISMAVSWLGSLKILFRCEKYKAKRHGASFYTVLS